MSVKFDNATLNIDIEKMYVFLQTFSMLALFTNHEILLSVEYTLENETEVCSYELN